MAKKKMKKQLLKAEKKLRQLQKEVEQLDRKLLKRKKQIVNLQRCLDGAVGETKLKETSSFENIQMSVASNVPRDVLRKAEFLLDRYEHHLGLSKTKRVARHHANQDMIENYGPDAGFTQQELEDVLS